MINVNLTFAEAKKSRYYKYAEAACFEEVPNWAAKRHILEKILTDKKSIKIMQLGWLQLQIEDTSQQGASISYSVYSKRNRIWSIKSSGVIRESVSTMQLKDITELDIYKMFSLLAEKEYNSERILETDEEPFINELFSQDFKECAEILKGQNFKGRIIIGNSDYDTNAISIQHVIYEDNRLNELSEEDFVAYIQYAYKRYADDAPGYENFPPASRCHSEISFINGKDNLLHMKIKGIEANEKIII